MATETERTPPADHNVEDLVWAMLDEQISDEDFRRLEELLRADEDARRLYMQCVQLHVDLTYWYNPGNAPARRAPVGLPIDVPVLGSDATMGDPAL